MANMRKSRRLRRNKKSARRVQRRTDRNTMRQQGGAYNPKYFLVTTNNGVVSAASTTDKTPGSVNNFDAFYNGHTKKDNATMKLSVPISDGTTPNEPIIEAGYDLTNNIQ